jgi:hypothetical protein
MIAVADHGAEGEFPATIGFLVLAAAMWRILTAPKRPGESGQVASVLARQIMTAIS